jgi:hydroxyethylthiazole kinase
LLEEDGGMRGVESLVDDQDLALRTSKSLAGRFGCVSAITGKTDVVSDGEAFKTIPGGNPWLKRITGSGCMATASIACFLAINPPLEASVLGLTVMKSASELAGSAKGPGSFEAALLDALYHLGYGS